MNIYYSKGGWEVDVENSSKGWEKWSPLEKLLSLIFIWYFNLLIASAFSELLIIEFISSFEEQIDKIIVMNGRDTKNWRVKIICMCLWLSALTAHRQTSTLFFLLWTVGKLVSTNIG